MLKLRPIPKLKSIFKLKPGFVDKNSKQTLINWIKAQSKLMPPLEITIIVEARGFN